MLTSKRLTTINSMITNNYQDIWDCCCDHGLLGFELLKRKAANTIHFADISVSLIDKLSKQLQQFFSGEDYINHWQVHALDVAKIPLRVDEENNKSAQQLIIIAGVGGDLLIELVQSIIHATPNTVLEFILCPVHHNYKVRTALLNQNCSLINECIVKENNRFYEIIHVTTSGSNRATLPIIKVGSIMWDLAHSEHQQYLKQCITHYTKMLKNSNIDAKTILHAYENLKSTNETVK